MVEGKCGRLSDSGAKHAWLLLPACASYDVDSPQGMLRVACADLHSALHLCGIMSFTICSISSNSLLLSIMSIIALTTTSYSLGLF
jgi:hypothetical protein